MLYCCWCDSLIYCHCHWFSVMSHTINEHNRNRIGLFFLFFQDRKKKKCPLACFKLVLQKTLKTFKALGKKLFVFNCLIVFKLISQLLGRKRNRWLWWLRLNLVNGSNFWLGKLIIFFILFLFFYNLNCFKINLYNTVYTNGTKAIPNFGNNYL